MEEHKREILQKSGLSENELGLFLSLLITRLEIVPSEESREWLGKAKEISPDPDDLQYFAIALKYDCGIWSSDGRLKEQSSVRI